MAPSTEQIAFLPTATDPPDWSAAIDRAVSDGAFTVVTQPIVDLARGKVVGYEALSRFGGPPPDRWFAIADDLGRGVDLAARVLHRQLLLRDHLPPNCFLAVNVAPAHLATDPVLAALSGPPLGGVVLELTEYERFDDLVALRRQIDRLRERGAMIALDDAGAGYAGLQALLELAPDIVKLDRSLIEGIHGDEAKLALVETTGALLSRIDSWLLAEGIEREAELEVLIRLGVPLGQGYLLSHPAPGWPRPPGPILDLVSGLHQRTTHGADVEALMEDAPLTDAGRGVAPLSTVGHDGWTIVVDARGRPLAVHRTGDGRALEPRRSAGLQTVKASERLADVVERALTRRTAFRFDPVVCTDARGRAIGLVRMERLVGEIARQTRVGHRP